MKVYDLKQESIFEIDQNRNQLHQKQTAWKDIYLLNFEC